MISQNARHKIIDLILIFAVIILSSCAPGATLAPSAAPTALAAPLPTEVPQPTSASAAPTIPVPTTVSAAPTIPAPTEAPTATISLATEVPTVIVPTATYSAATKLPTAGAESTIAASTVIPLNLDDIDNALAKSPLGNIAYNPPTSMKVDEIITFELLISPNVSQTKLVESIEATQGNKPNVNILSSEIIITPRMTAELISADPDAFIITPLQDMEEQWLTNTEPTDWKWTVKAKKGGNQILTLIINRIVQVDGKDYSRPVASYTRNLYVTVTVPSIISQIDWKWSLTTIFIPIIIWLYKRRKPDAGQTPKPAK